MCIHYLNIINILLTGLLEGIMHHGDQSRVNENNYTEIISCARLMTRY